MPPAPAHTPRRRSLLSPLLGRRADSFSIAELDALPELTAFAHRHNEPFTRVGALWCLDGRAELSLTSAELHTSECVCIAVGEPTIEGVERPDGIDALTSLDALLPASTVPLNQIDEVPYHARRGRMSAAAVAELVQTVQRQARIAAEHGCDLSIIVGRGVVEVHIVGTTPDLISAVREGDHMRDDVGGVSVIWRAS